MIRTTTRPSAPASNPTREWVLDALMTKRLDRRLASYLHRHFPTEDYDELLGFVGLLLAKWCERDTFATYLAEGKLTVSTVKGWTRQKWVTRMSRLGTEPLHRLHGKRSEIEVEANRFAGKDLGEMCQDAMTRCADMADVATVYDDEGESIGHEIVDSSLNAEDVLSDHRDRAAALAEGRRYVAATFRDAADRYLSIFDALFVWGESREKIAEREGCTVQRISQLTTKVRNSVRDGAVIRDDARRLFAFLSSTPDSDEGVKWSEVNRVLRMDKPRANRAVAYLAQDGITVEVDKGRYSLTAGHKATKPTED